MKFFALGFSCLQKILAALAIASACYHLHLKALTVNDVLNRAPSASVSVLRVVRVGVPKC